MEAKPNPYVGTGLAIHRYVALWTGCYRVTFVPDPDTQDVELSFTERLLCSMRDLTGRAV